MLGGEVAAWSEMFSDLNIHSRIWPRAAAMADKLWGDNVKDIDLTAVVKRQNAFADLLNGRGLNTTPITGRYCEINADHCFSKYKSTQNLIGEESLFI